MLSVKRPSAARGGGGTRLSTNPSPAPLGPALGEQDLRIPDDIDKSQIAGFTQLWTRPSVRCVPQVHGWMTLVERHPTIYLRAEKSNVAETELGKTKALRS